jgi:two-component system chemotaxis sensor kinase CheA
MADDRYKYFRIEARELMQQLGKATLDLERGEKAPERVPHLLRLAHTLKGAARVVKQREIAELAHAVEEALDPFRAHAGTVPQPSVEALLALVDQIRARVVALDTPSSQAGAPPSALAPAPPSPSSSSSSSSFPSLAPVAAPPGEIAPVAVALPPEAPQRTLRADLAEVDDLLEGVAEAHGQLGALRRSVGTIERARRLAEVLLEQLGAPNQARGPGAVEKARSLAEELRGLVSTIEQSLGRGVEQVDRELQEVRQTAQRLRLLPAGAMFDVLERTARDAALALGRRVAFETKGGDVRLDADVLGGVQSALVQMVRNAVAHGIEAEADRTAAGKPAAGTIRLEIERRGGRAAFRCHDDGRGVDLQAVRRAAGARGLSAIQAEALSDDDLISLLLKGGISTSRTVTAVSGRGIGLDVVREVAERLGGRIDVKTERGRGTTVEIAVPISLSSLEALVVEIDDRTAAIPLEAIRQIVRLGAKDIARTSDGESIVYEGQAIPFMPLSGPLRAGFGTSSSASSSGAARAWSAVVIQGATGHAAVGVDRLCGTETIVVQPLPESMTVDPVVAGASLDAEGNPQLVLHPESLVAAAARLETRERPAAKRKLPVLVVDDSLTTRMLEQSILELAGYEVDLATSGEEALEKAAQRRYALFLVDVEMPGMDGFTFVATTQKDPVLREVPAVLVTSRNAPEDRQRGKTVGAKAYIVKSEFNQNELLDRIGKLVA